VDNPNNYLRLKNQASQGFVRPINTGQSPDNSVSKPGGFSLEKLQNRAKPVTNVAPQTQESIQSYKYTSIETASPERLLIMLYDGAIKFLNIASNAINDKQVETSHKNILKAEAIIIELMSILDMDIGGEISVNLFNLYDFMYRHLVNANINQDTQKIQDVIDILNELRGAWVEAANIVNQMKKDGKINNNIQGQTPRKFAG